MGTIISLIFIIFLIVLAVRCVQGIIYRVKELGKMFSGDSGNSNSSGSSATFSRIQDFSGTDKAYQLIADNAKGQWVPKWIADEAISMLQSYYSPNDAAQQVYNFMKVRDINIADFPKETYHAPGTDTNILADYCIECIAGLECIKNHIPDDVPDKDIDTLCNLAFVLYFADNDMKTYPEAQMLAMDMLTDYKKHIGLITE